LVVEEAALIAAAALVAGAALALVVFTWHLTLETQALVCPVKDILGV
jgi:hypothetical protein